MSTSKTICPISTQTVSLFEWLKFLFYLIYTSIVISSLCELYCMDYVLHSPIHPFMHSLSTIMEFPLEDFHPHTSTLYFAHSFAHTHAPIFFFLYIYIQHPSHRPTVYRMSQKLWFRNKVTQYAWTQDLIVGVGMLAYGEGWGIWLKRLQRHLVEVSRFFIGICWKRNVKTENGLGHRQFLIKPTQFVKHHTIQCHVISEFSVVKQPTKWKEYEFGNLHLMYRHSSHAVLRSREVPSRNWAHIRSTINVDTRESISVTNPSTPEPDRPQQTAWPPVLSPSSILPPNIWA